MKSVLDSLLLTSILLALLAPPLWSDAEIEEQVAQLTEKIELQPRNPSLLVRRADLYRRGGDWGNAIEDLRGAKALAGPNAGYDLGMARLLEDMGRARAALHFANHLLILEPRSAAGLELRARLHTALGRMQQAVWDYDKRLALTTRAEPDLWLARARVQANLGQESAALAGIEDGLKKLKHCLALELHALELEQELELFAPALARVNRLAAGSARQEGWHARRGQIYQRAGQTVQAIGCYRNALRCIEGLRASRRNTALIRELTFDLKKRIAELQ